MKHTGQKREAFSLIELLVVIAIIGVLAAISMPTLRGLAGSDKVNAAATQLADDLSFARNKAIAERTTVYVVFVSPTIVQYSWNSLNDQERRQLGNLLTGQYTAYAIYSHRSLGDQPGPGRSRYLTEWQRLPEGMFISTNEFQVLPSDTWRTTASTNRPFVYREVPFPTAQSRKVLLPCVVFNYQGQLVHQVESTAPTDEFIYLSQGAVMPARTADGQPDFKPAVVVERPKTNWMKNPYVRVDWLTGRARVEQRPML